MTLDAAKIIATQICLRAKERRATTTVVAVANADAYWISTMGTALDVEGLVLLTEREVWRQQYELCHPHAMDLAGEALLAGASAVVVSFSRGGVSLPCVARAGDRLSVFGLLGRMAAYREDLWKGKERIDTAEVEISGERWDARFASGASLSSAGGYSAGGGAQVNATSTSIQASGSSGQSTAVTSAGVLVGSGGGLGGGCGDSQGATRGSNGR